MEAAAWKLKTRSGLQVDVRAANEDDEHILDQFFHRVRPEDLRFRFLTSMKEVSPGRLHDMTHIDHLSTETFLAFCKDENTPIATAMLAKDGKGDRAEVAISVRADHRAEGVGWALLDFVAKQASGRGIRTLQSLESRDNHDANCS